jgi:hypothetical protein
MKTSRLLSIFLIAAFFSFSANLNAQCTGKGKALETIGALSGMSCYDAYSAIGAVADGFEKDVYKGDYVKEIMTEEKTMLMNLDSSYIDLMNSGFITNQDDKDFIAQVRKTLGYLISEANALANYSDGKSASDADEFQSYRDKAWKEISSMLGFGD